MIDEQLKEFGLSEKETKVYLSLLELGTASVQEIAKSSDLNRSTAYVILESLLDRGLINIAEKSDTRIYSPIPPELLIRKTAELVNKYSKIEKDIQSIIPDLQSLSKSLKRKPRILFFEGIQGIKSIYEGSLGQEKGAMIRTFSRPGLWEILQPGYYTNISKKMSDQGIKVRAIQPVESKKISSKKGSSEILYIPSDRYNFTSDLSIYENKVILISPQDQYGVIIENEDIAHTMKELFDLAWEEARRINDKNYLKLPLIPCQH